jgi:hypothetical protein
MVRCGHLSVSTLLDPVAIGMSYSNLELTTFFTFCGTR